ncbi:MAG: hypothetical protein K2J18_03485 [Paramuribaculum sp.]|nr:hypothetical protein [Paramuribaculum sp.]
MTDRNPLSETDRRTGMTVPDGYFDNFNLRMAEMLHEQSWEAPQVMDRTFWQRVRPFVYLAAMFAGIWLMMNMSTFFAPGLGDGMQLSAPESLAQLLSNIPENIVDDYTVSNLNTADLLDDLYSSGFDPVSLH